MLINDIISNMNQCPNHHTINTTFCGFLQSVSFVFLICYLRKINLILTSIYDSYTYNDYLSKRSETYLYLSLTIFQFLDRVIYARKEGEGGASGSVLEAGEKITLDQASVSILGKF